MAKKFLTNLERFYNHILKVNNNGWDYWEWQSACNKGGYGQFHIGSRTDNSCRPIGAHRWSYENFIGPIPVELQIDHKCNNRCCVNPDHLQAVTLLRNVQLGWERGTHVAHFT